MTESAYLAAREKIASFTVVELDAELERTAAINETSEMLLCVYLAAMQKRGGYRDFGYDSIYDYAKARFSFGDRKTRYLVYLGNKIEGLPKIREALANGELGWCKAVRVASVASEADEAMWLESALSLSLRDLERRIKDGTDTLASVLSFALSEDRRVLWENVLELFRRRAGAEISPVEAFEYLCAEAMAQYGCVVEDASHDALEDESADVDEPEPEPSPEPEAPIFPWAESVDTSAIAQGSLWVTEQDAEVNFARGAGYNELRQLVLERDGWRCCYPGCSARKNLEVHHIRFRSRGGPDEPWNLCVTCTFHHKLIHAGQITLKGRAPTALEWTPPKLMREVLDRRRNKKPMSTHELDVREWALDPAPAVT